jgi:hypothetical protein
MIGKITILNSLALAPFLYLGNIISFPNRVYKEVKTLVLDFLWDGMTPKVSYNTLIKPMELGGLNLMDLKSKVWSLKLNWINRITKCDGQGWTSLFKYITQTEDSWKAFIHNRLINLSTNCFYYELFNIWKEITKPGTLNATWILAQPLWHNIDIKMDNSIVSWKDWQNKGIYFIRDIINDEGEMLSLKELTNKYNISCNFLQYHHLKKSVPNKWWRELTNRDSNFRDVNIPREKVFLVQNNTYINMEALKSKNLYEIIMKQNTVIVSSIRKWETEFPLLKNVDPEFWANLFTRVYKYTYQTKLQSFQYRIIHNYINCNKRLYDWRILSSPVCAYCNKEDDIIHFFLKCDNVRNFWKLLIKVWNRIEEPFIDLCRDDLFENIIFGFNLTEEIYYLLNFVILQAKWFIYKRRLFVNNDCCLFDFLVELKYNLSIVIFILKNKNLEERLKVFRNFYDEL